MTDQQKTFLELAVIKQIKYGDITKQMNVDQKTLSKWWNELKNERIILSDLRKLWIKKCKDTNFWDFKKWHEEAKKECYYCEINEAQIHQLLDNKLIKTKRITTRGKKLEIERLSPNVPYDDLSNLVFCCYWCNNAKTDEFTEDEFKPIGQAIKAIWNSRLARKDRFVDENAPGIEIIKKR